MADAFDDSWESVLNDPNTPTMSTEYGRVERKPLSEPSIAWETEDSGGDVCCTNAKNLWEEAIIETFPPGWDDPADYTLIDPETGQPDESPLRDDAALQSIEVYSDILEKYRNMSCEAFRAH